MSKKPNILKRFAQDKRGSAYVLAAFSLIPMFGMAALAVDYTNFDRTRTDLETAAETVALHVAKRVALNPSGSASSFEEEGKQIFASLVNIPVTYETFSVNTLTGKVQIVAKTDVKTSFAQMFGHESLTAITKTQAQFGRQNIEVAIAIDNSGSMEENAAAVGSPFKTRMNSAKDGAKILIKSATDSVDSLENANIKFSVIPWNQQVRVPAVYTTLNNGKSQPWIDWEGQSVDHFRYLAPYNNIGDMYFKMPKRKSNWGGAATEDEWAYYDPNLLKDYLPLTSNGQGVDLVALKNKPGIKLVTRRDVFDRFSNADWKGCFDHRAGDFKTSFVAPDQSKGNSLYLPHFAPDEYDYDTSDGYRSIRIDYIDDIGGDSDFVKAGSQTLTSGDSHDGAHLSVSQRANYFTSLDIWRARTFNTPKYAGSGKVQTRNKTMPWYAQERAGPNIDCFVPPMIGLSDDVDGINNTKSPGALQTTIDAMTSNGATDLSIGLSWAVNTLTPWEPLATAGDFSNTQKILVIMTDGDNTINQPNNYSYGHSPHGYVIDDPLDKGWDLDGPSTAEVGNAIVDEVSLKMCQSAREMGVKIYFIYFGSSAPSARAEALKNNCASTPETAIWAKNGQELEDTFKKIGDDVGRLRLTHYKDEE